MSFELYNTKWTAQFDSHNDLQLENRWLQVDRWQADYKTSNKDNSNHKHAL